MFIVVDVNLDYDYVEGVEYVEKFDSGELAIGYIELIQKKWKNDWQTRKQYVDDFVSAIKMPESGYDEWNAFIVDYPLPLNRATPNNFLTRLKYYLYKNYSDTEMILYGWLRDRYDPPVVDCPNGNNLYVVEIKETDNA